MLTTIIALAAASTSVSTPAPTDLAAWIAQVNQQIGKKLRVPDNNELGMATVSFRRDENGHPVDIQVRSGSHSIAQAAIRSVKAAGTLPPMPNEVPASQRITFKFLVGMTGHEREYNRALARMLESANRTNMALAARLETRTQLAAIERR